MNVNFSEGSRGGAEKTEMGNLSTLDPQFSSSFRTILDKFPESCLPSLRSGRPPPKTSAGACLWFRGSAGGPTAFLGNGQPVPSQP